MLNIYFDFCNYRKWFPSSSILHCDIHLIYIDHYKEITSIARLRIFINDQPTEVWSLLQFEDQNKSTGLKEENVTLKRKNNELTLVWRDYFIYLEIRLL